MTDRPPLWSVLGTLVGAPLFIGAVIIYVPYVLTGWRLAPPFFGWEGSRGIGVALIIVPVPILVDLAMRFVRQGHGTPVPVAPPQRLVVSGVFRWVRNPAYLAAVGALVGQGLVFASRPVLIYALAMWIAFHLLVVVYEEPTLRRKFGAEYEDYCRRVPRWVPRLPRSMVEWEGVST